MIVCAHGEVSEYCENHDMIIVEKYDGDIESYRGVCRVLVTDRDMSSGEYYYLKGKMLAQGIELVSTRYVDMENLNYQAVLTTEQQYSSHAGRPKFGERSEAERVVVERIFELRDAGYTLRQISEDDKVGYLDGRKLSVSTIQTILKNRNRY